MSKNKKKVTHSKIEKIVISSWAETIPRQVIVKIVFVSLVILALAMIIGFSLLG